MWCIRSIVEPALAWSNKQGWVSGADLDRFSDDDRRTLNLPIGGEWRRAPLDPEAMTLDIAVDNFDQAASDRACADLLATAVQYHRDGMISDDTLHQLIARIADWLRDE